jgi:hypothetical protein
MSEQNGWEKAKELIVYRLDELSIQTKEVGEAVAAQNKGLGEAVQALRDEMSSLKAEVIEKSATKSEVAEIRNELHELKLEYTRDIAQLKVKAGTWGAMAGTAPVLLTLGIAAISWLIG